MSEQLPHVIKKHYVSVVIKGHAYAFDSTHPTFNELRNALLEQRWAEVPKLLSAAEKVSNESRGTIQVVDNQVLYKGQLVDNSLTQRILALMKDKKPVAYMLKFMDNLYKNPSEVAINELYDWLQGCKLPITDDGCFVAYKSVRDNYTDMYTGTISNKIGRSVFMRRKDVDPNRNNHCSRGLHFCSATYAGQMGGARLVQVKINPRDVVSIPNDYSFTKGRTWRYEVFGETNDQEREMVYGSGKDIEAFKTSVVEVAKDRQELLKLILENPTVKNRIKSGKLKHTTIVKQTFGRLKAMAVRFKVGAPVSTPPEESAVLSNPMKQIRTAGGYSLQDVAKKLGINYKAVWALENSPNPRQDSIDQYITAIQKLQGEVSEAVTA